MIQPLDKSTSDFDHKELDETTTNSARAIADDQPTMGKDSGAVTSTGLKKTHVQRISYSQLDFVDKCRVSAATVPTDTSSHLESAGQLHKSVNGVAMENKDCSASMMSVRAPLENDALPSGVTQPTGYSSQFLSKNTNTDSLDEDTLGFSEDEE